MWLKVNTTIISKMNTCNTNFKSKFAKIDNVSEPVDIDEYLSNKYSSRDTYIPRCIPHGHELTAVNSITRSKHFRHKHNIDVSGTPMTQWHINWQAEFPITEQRFEYKDGQRKNRRADVVLPDTKQILEFQHSNISSGEVADRNRDYQLHNHSVIWIIDGQNSISEKRLGERLVLHFISNTWLYENFLDCNIVYYDIEGLIYKVDPKLVRSHQIDVSPPKIKSEFVEALKYNKDLWNNIEDPAQCTLYVKQQGAGSGKTYGIMQLLNEDPEISNFKYITFITKQHSAVYVMFSEFMKQYKASKLSNIQLIEPAKYDEEDEIKEKEKKKHIIKYRHLLTGVETYAIFGTVDSFTYALATPPKNTFDQFVGIVNSIKNGTIKTEASGKIKYADVNPIINKEMLIIIDETQDLTELYAEAFLRIVTSKHTNLCVVGDRLQSLSNQKNALTFLHRVEKPMIKVLNSDVINAVRRFSDPELIKFVNSMIPFEKYDLPLMTPVNICEHIPGALTIFTAKTVYANESAESENVVEAVENIMTLFRKEVENNQCVPEDFLFVTPFTKKNPIMETLQIALNSYWKEIMQDNVKYIENVKSKHEYWKNIDANKYTRYAVFHKSEEGSSINLGDSTNATRMVSIHSSKGDGRKVVFVIGVTQSALQRFSQVADNIIYDSLLHVAITRQKERLYFRLEENGDDIHMRINRSGVTPSTKTTTEFDIPSSKIKLSDISDDISKFSFEDIYETLISKYKRPDMPSDSDRKLLIDMGDHHIRYSSIFINVMVHSANYDIEHPSDTTKQYFSIFAKIKGDILQPVDTWRGYMNILQKNYKNYKNNENTKSKKFIPILTFTSKQNDIDYQKYFLIIFNTMLRIISELESLGKKKLNHFCPLECVVLYYMKECIEEGIYQKITINDLYNIVDIYSKVFNYETATGHENCRCKEHFTNINSKLSTSEIKYQEYLCNHYNRLTHINNILDSFDAENSKVTWLYNHPIVFNGNKNFKIYSSHDIVGYDDKNVYIFYIKPQLNKLNLNDFLVGSILNTYIILNISKDSNNYSRFNGKNIISCVLSLNKEDLYSVNWVDAVNNNIPYIQQKVFDAIYKKFNIKHSSHYNTFMNIYNENKNNPNEIVERCIAESNKIRNLPEYISTIWKGLSSRIDDNEDEDDDIFKAYIDKEKFIKKFDRALSKSLEKFLETGNNVSTTPQPQILTPP